MKNKLKLNLGISISLPVDSKFILPEYSSEPIDSKELEDIEYDHSISKTKFNSLQIMFTKNNLTSKEIKNINEIIKQLKFTNVFVHASYQINIGAEMIASKSDLYSPGLDLFIKQIEYAIKINSLGIVIHMGKNVGLKSDPDIIYNNMVNFVIKLFYVLSSNKLFKKSKKFLILFETPAGQGGEMCWDIENFVNFIQIFKHQHFYDKIGVCIDTCHIFQAGYDLNDKNIIKNLHQILNPIKNKIKLIHLNDSAHELGKHLDRHAQIGKGYINTNRLIKFILPYINLPLILETKPPYYSQVKLLEQY